MVKIINNWLEIFLLLSGPKPNFSHHWWLGAIRVVNKFAEVEFRDKNKLEQNTPNKHTIFSATSSGSSSSRPNLNIILLFLYVSKLHSTTGPSADLSIFFNWILGNLSFLAGFVPVLSFFSADDALDEWESTEDEDDEEDEILTAALTFPLEVVTGIETEGKSIAVVDATVVEDNDEEFEAKLGDVYAGSGKLAAGTVSVEVVIVEDGNASPSYKIDKRSSIPSTASLLPKVFIITIQSHIPPQD